MAAYRTLCDLPLDWRVQTFQCMACASAAVITYNEDSVSSGMLGLEPRTLGLEPRGALNPDTVLVDIR